jgi:hypothetical protein
MSTKRCSKCGLVKLLADFHSNGPSKYRSACKECEKVRDAQRRPTVPRPPAQTKEQLLAWISTDRSFAKHRRL